MDTSALLALAVPRDQYHDRASESLAKARAAGVTWVSTFLVLGELHGHLLRYLSPARAVDVVRALMADPSFDWVDVDGELARGALTSWMTRFGDQPISLTDAVTFEVMRREKLKVAFAYDRHFLLAGYRVLD